MMLRNMMSVSGRIDSTILKILSAAAFCRRSGEGDADTVWLDVKSLAEVLKLCGLKSHVST